MKTSRYYFNSFHFLKSLEVTPKYKLSVRVVLCNAMKQKVYRERCPIKSLEVTSKQNYASFFILITFAGFPTTVALSGISFNTTAPAPTVTQFPIFTPCITVAPIPI